MATLALVVNGLNKLDAILPAASARERHVGYGVKAVHYATVGAALLWTLEKGLGPSWTPELAAAWTLAYDLVRLHDPGGIRPRCGGHVRTSRRLT